MISALLLHAGLLGAGGVLTWLGSRHLERSAADLSVRYGLPPLIQGTIVVAVGSSFPELATTVISTLVHGSFDLGVATLVGSAVFNILVIPGLAGIRSGPLDPRLRLVYRDAQFYLTSVAVLLLAFSFALIYEPVPGSDLVGTLTRPIALVPVLLYGLYVFLQRQDYRDMESPPERGTDPEEVRTGRAWLLLAGSIVMIVAGVEALLRTAIWLGEVVGTPSFLWGATVVAAVTSVPDALVSVSQAEQGEGDVSLGNVLGSNIFDLLVAIPAGVLVAGSAPVDFGVAAPLMAFLTLATVALFTVLRTRVTLDRREAWALLALYVLFVVWLALETADLSTLLA